MFFRNKNGGKNNTDTYIENKDEDIKIELTTENIKKVLEINSDIKFHKIFINNDKDLLVNIIYVDGLIDTNQINNFILKPLIQEPDFKHSKSSKDLIRSIDNGRLYYINQGKITDANQALYALVSGLTLIVVDSEKIAYAFDAKSFETRSIEEPSNESVIKGAKDGFVEVLRTNTATCRRKIKSHNLIIEESKVGKQSKTPVAIVYMKNIANKTIIDEVKKRLSSIEVDRVTTVGYIEELIIDKKSSPFPQILYTERPDKFCTNIVDGRIGIIIDGVPIAYIIPATLLQFLQTNEDYALHFTISSLIRFLRFSSAILTLVLPSFYIAITSFHQEMIPTDLATSIASAKEGVPFPMFIEVMLMLAAFEALVEAGLRLPKTIGQAVSIVGALVVGQSAVEAKLVSPATVVTIAITAISSFTMPNQDFSNALRLWRFILVILSSIVGIFGLSSGLIFLIYHLCSIETFGVPYLSPFVASDGKQLKDTMFRFPLYMHKKRPRSLRPINKRRMK